MMNGAYNNYTLILAKRNHDKLGQLVNVDSIVNKINMNAANELSFTVYKYNDKQKYFDADDGEKYKYIEPLWDEITDFKYVWVKELDEYYEIAIEVNDSDSEYKTITGTSACEVELGQVYVHGLEVNNENDPNIDTYTTDRNTSFYNPDDTSISLLHRVLSVVPHYSIDHVDNSLKNIRRQFSIDGADVYSTLTSTIAEEIGCLFLFDSANRTISAYDLMTVCKDCGHRDEFDDICPECGSTNLQYYGEDTTVYIDQENLAESVTFITDTGAVKNCFRLEAGDDDMTAVIRSCNPNGSQYIYYFSDDIKHEMSEELVDKIESYDELIESYTPQYEENMENLFEAYEKESYYNYSMMPSILGGTPVDPEDEPRALEDWEYYGYIKGQSEYKRIEIKAGAALPFSSYDKIFKKVKGENSYYQAVKLQGSELSPIGIEKFSVNTSKTTVESAIKNYAKVYIKSGYYKVEISDGSEYQFVDPGGNKDVYGVWSGKFKITNYSDKDDVEETDEIIIIVNGDYEYYIKQLVDKQTAQINKNEDDGDLFNVLSVSNINDFTDYIKFYCLSRLTSFADAINSAIEIMVAEGQNEEDGSGYSLYVKYQQKIAALNEEIAAREREVKYWTDKIETYTNVQVDIQKTLNFEEYLGKELYTEFCTFKREDTYKNDNYISDGMSNAEQFENAKKFIDAAKIELYKSGEKQHSISANLYNLFAIREFKSLKDNFAIGNWVRVRSGDEVYRLRLVSYQLSMNDKSSLDVEFSDVTKMSGGMSDLQSIISKASSMATTYDSTVRQVKKDTDSALVVKNWVSDGIDLTNNKIVGNVTNQNFTIGERGFLGRKYDDITETYSPEQIKLINNGLYITDDNWKTISSAIGKIVYTDPQTKKEVTDFGVIAKKVIGKLILGEELGIYSSSGQNEMIFDDNGLKLVAKRSSEGKYSDSIISIEKIENDGSTKRLLYLDAYGNLQLNANLTISSSGEDIVEYVNDKTINKINKVDVEYALGSSNTVAPTSGWQTTAPEWNPGKYMWQRTASYTDASKDPIYSAATCIQGASTYSAILSNESQIISANTTSAIPGSYTTDVIGFYGTTQIKTKIGSISGVPKGMTAVISNNNSKNSYITFVVTSDLTTESGQITIPVAIGDGEVTINKEFSYALSFGGESAKVVTLSASTQVFKCLADDATYFPTDISIIANLQNLSSSDCSWSYSADGGSSWTSVSSGSHGITITDSTNLNFKNNSDLFTSSVTSIAFKCTNNSYEDVMTIYKVKDGDNGTSPYMGMLSNESQVFAAGIAKDVSTTLSGFYGATSKNVQIKTVNGIAANTSSTATGKTGMNFKVSSTSSISSPVITFSSTTSLKQSQTEQIPIVYRISGDENDKTIYFSYSTTTTGSNGEPANLVDILCSSQSFKSTDGKTYTPDAITLNPRFQTVTYNKWQYSTNGGKNWTDVASGSHGLTISTNNLTINKESDLFTSAITAIQFKCISSNSSIYDVMTIYKLTDGVGISSITELYYTSTSTAAPSKPTTSTTISSSKVYDAWSTQCADYKSEVKGYYTCSKIVYEDETIEFTDVCSNGGYTSANENANNANNTSNGIKNDLIDGTNNFLKTVNGNALNAGAIKGNAVTTPITLDGDGYLNGDGMVFDLDNSYIKAKNFQLNADGSAKFKGELEAATGTFNGALSANCISAANLIVGENVTMGENARISWGNVDDQPTIPTSTSELTNDSDFTTIADVEDLGYQTSSQVTQITKDTVTTSYVNALNVTAKDISATNISGKNITGSTLKNTYTDSSGYVSYNEINGLNQVTVNRSKEWWDDDVQITKSLLSGGVLRLSHFNGESNFSAYKEDAFLELYCDNGLPYIVANNGTASASIILDGDGGTNVYWRAQPKIVSGSDERLKENIIDIDDDYANLLHKVNPRFYNFKGQTERNSGFIAQEFNEAITNTGDGNDYCVEKPAREGAMWSLDYNGIYALLWKIVQKKDDELQELKSKVSSLEERLAKLETLLNADNIKEQYV